MTNPPAPGSSPYAPQVLVSRGAGNPLGRIAFVLALVAAVIGFVQQMLGSFLPVIAYDAGISPTAIGAGLSVLTFVRLLAGVAALAVGLVAMTRRGLPQLGAGIAIGVGGYTVVSAILGLLVGPIFSLIY